LLICTVYCQCCIVYMPREMFGHYHFLIKKNSHKGSACFCVRVPLCLLVLTSEPGDQFSTELYIHVMSSQTSSTSRLLMY
jgi:hypothetical protein